MSLSLVFFSAKLKCESIQCGGRCRDCGVVCAFGVLYLWRCCGVSIPQHNVCYVWIDSPFCSLSLIILQQEDPVSTQKCFRHLHGIMLRLLGAPFMLWFNRTMLFTREHRMINSPMVVLWFFCIFILSLLLFWSVWMQCAQTKGQLSIVEPPC